MAGAARARTTSGRRRRARRSWRRNESRGTASDGFRIIRATPSQTSVSTMLPIANCSTVSCRTRVPRYTTAGRQHVAAAHEERVDRLLRLVLLLAGRRQPEQLTRGVHDRVVGRVLGRLDPAHHREADAGGDDGVAAERDERQRQQRAAQARVFDEARGDERLQQERGDVDPELIVAAERADDTPAC